MQAQQPTKAQIKRRIATIEKMQNEKLLTDAKYAELSREYDRLMDRLIEGDYRDVKPS